MVHLIFERYGSFHLSKLSFVECAVSLCNLIVATDIEGLSSDVTYLYTKMDTEVSLTRYLSSWNVVEFWNLYNLL